MQLKHFVPILAGLVCGTAAAVLPDYVGDQPKAAASQATAVFAGGCFWGVDAVFKHTKGVSNVVSGYAGGSAATAQYYTVGTGTTGHAESVEVTYDPTKITYERLLDVIWHNIDPVTANQQFCDRGTQYRAAIFYHDELQRQLAEASKAALEAEKRFSRYPDRAGDDLLPGGDYHQHDYAKNPLRYKYYRYGCGRDQRLRELWGPPAAGATRPCSAW